MAAGKAEEYSRLLGHQEPMAVGSDIREQEAPVQAGRACLARMRVTCVVMVGSPSKSAAPI
jgi:hypothetical protein